MKNSLKYHLAGASLIGVVIAYGIHVGHEPLTILDRIFIIFPITTIIILIYAFWVAQMIKIVIPKRFIQNKFILFFCGTVFGGLPFALYFQNYKSSIIFFSLAAIYALLFLIVSVLDNKRLNFDAAKKRGAS